MEFTGKAGARRVSIHYLHHTILYCLEWYYVLVQHKLHNTTKHWSIGPSTVGTEEAHLNGDTEALDVHGL